MAALLVGMSIMAVLMSAALPVWTHYAQREKEEELIWRGQQYARAIMLFQRKFANTFPPTIDLLVEQKFLRRKYKDPITNDDFQPIPAGGGVVPGQLPGPGPGQGQGFGGQQGAGRAPGQAQGPPGQAGPQTGFGTPQTPPGGGFGQMPGPNIGIQGVVSKSKDTSIKIYNGRQKYNEWAFVALQAQQRVGVGTPILRPTGGQQQPGQPPTFQPGQQGQPRPPGFGPGGGFPGSPGSPTRPPVFGPGGGGFPPGGAADDPASGDLTPGARPRVSLRVDRGPRAPCA